MFHAKFTYQDENYIANFSPISLRFPKFYVKYTKSYQALLKVYLTYNDTTNFLG